MLGTKRIIKSYSKKNNSFHYCCLNDWNVNMWFVAILVEAECKVMIKDKSICSLNSRVAALCT